MNINLADITDLKEVETGYLLGTIHIMDTPHHLALIEVQADAWQTPVGSSLLDEMLNDIRRFDGADGPYHTVLYNDKEYVCAITPYCR